MKYAQAIDFVWQIIIAIALPAVVFGLGGSWLDKHVGYAPAFTLIGFACSLGVTYLLIMRRVRRFLSEQKNEGQHPKKPS